jgi:hypothetical protein
MKHIHFSQSCEYHKIFLGECKYGSTEEPEDTGARKFMNICRVSLFLRFPCEIIFAKLLVYAILTKHLNIKMYENPRHRIFL